MGHRSVMYILHAYSSRCVCITNVLAVKVLHGRGYPPRQSICIMFVYAPGAPACGRGVKPEGARPRSGAAPHDASR
jgi:hypothetical protein